MGDLGTSGSANLADHNLVLLYVPTAYGTTDPALPGSVGDDEDESKGGLSVAEVNAERAQSKADNDARIQAELARMQAQIDES